MSPLYQILKNKRNPQLPKHIILIIVENYSYMSRLHLNFEFSFRYSIFKYYRIILNCGKRGRLVISRQKGEYVKKTIIQEEFGKVEICYSTFMKVQSGNSESSQIGSCGRLLRLY